MIKTFVRFDKINTMLVCELTNYLAKDKVLPFLKMDKDFKREHNISSI